MKRTVSRIGSIGGQLMLGVWLVVVLVPLIAALLSTVKSNTEIYSDPLGINFSDLRFYDFIDALKGPVGGAPLMDYVGNSVIATLSSIIIGMSTGMVAAYGLARVESRLTKVLTRVFTVLITIPILVTLVPLFFLTGTLGIRDNPFGLGLVYAAFMVPPTTVMMRPFFAAFPRELIESAKLDGAREARTFLRVVLPVVFPKIIGVIIVNVIWAWSELALALVLMVTPGSKTLPVGLLAFQGEYYTNLGVQAAGLVIAAVPMVIVYSIFSRRVTEGMAAGATK
jgi:ABC-type glycerol-3-phosphate transport system permease component